MRTGKFVVTEKNNMAAKTHLVQALVSYVVVKTSTRRRSRIPCVVVEKITTRRREGKGVATLRQEEAIASSWFSMSI